jgi:phenylpropionate dioxygenase-like ring-hydroxylating dioxygenase large terminal subunit
MKVNEGRQRIGDVAEILLDYFEHNKTFQTDKILTVPARSYTDPDQWRAEMDLIFKRLPLMLALSCEMPHPGDYKAMEAVGLPILITRDKEGTVRAFLNVCAHRGALVAAEGHGHCPRFTCPFHGWTYGADGKLIGVADAAKFGNLDKSKHGLKELSCEERYGMIFVCLTPGTSLDLDGYYGAQLDDFADAGLKDWSFLGSRVLEGANWKIAFDTFIDGYHFATVHPKTVFPDTPSNMTHYEGFGPHLRIGYPSRSIGTLRELPRAQWGQREGQEFSFIRTLFPNVTAFLSGEDVSLFTQNFPGPTPDKNRTVLLYARRNPPKDEADQENIEEKIKWMRDVTQDEDYAIGIRVQKGLEAGAHEHLLFGHNERGNQYFYEWVNWYLQGDPTLPKPVL